MKIAKRNLFDVLFALVCWCIGAFLYSVVAGRDFDLLFNLVGGPIVSGFFALRLHKQRQRKTVQQNIPADA
jgi:hypothetical protein